jgi:hypothetical protein
MRGLAAGAVCADLPNAEDLSAPPLLPPTGLGLRILMSVPGERFGWSLAKKSLPGANSGAGTLTGSSAGASSSAACGTAVASTSQGTPAAPRNSTAKTSPVAYSIASSSVFS